MKFSWKTDNYVLVQQWTTTTSYELIAAIVTSCGLAIAAQYLHELLGSRSRDKRTRRQIRKFLLVQSILYSLLVFIGNLLMLFLMTYNLWIFVSILLGGAIGYFFFFPLLVQNSNNQNLNGNNAKQLDGSVSKEQIKLLAKENSANDFDRMKESVITSCASKNGRTPSANDDINFVLESPLFERV